MGKGNFYITTPIYYPSDHLHIGHAYTTVYCDTLARWHRFKGEDVFFLTGSDEHGQKIERAAAAAGLQPKEYVDKIVATFQALWARLGISYDDFIRTTQDRHHKVVQDIFRRLYEQGDIYKSTYTGLYCTPCESFWTESKLVDGKCPDCDRPVEVVQEESYFFRMSKYAPALLAHIQAHPEFIQPASRRHEMISFIKQGLEDLCVSRTTFDWGVPVPMDENHVIYVWIDALTNYLTAAGYLQDNDKFARWWPANVHVVGKDILRFHTIIWPAILMAAGIPLPEQVYGHGWVLVDSGKMSKSKGNVVDPNILMDEFGTDAIRYFLLREVAFGQDAKYARRNLVERINADLANDLGNALHRSLSMLERFCGGVVPTPTPTANNSVDTALQELAASVCASVDQCLLKLQANLALVEIWRLVSAVNKYIDDNEPWALAKDEAKKVRLDNVMYNVCEALRIIALLVAPFLPGTGASIWSQLGLANIAASRQPNLQWGGLPAGTRVAKGAPLFPRIDLDEALAEDGPAPTPKQEKPTRPEKPVKPDGGAAPMPVTNNETDELVSIDEFARIKLRVAVVQAAEPIPGANKLLKLQVSLGEEQRQIVAGIAKYYQPEDLIGKKVVVVANLKPAKLRGVESQGMLLAASDEAGELGLLTVLEDIAPGAEVS